MKSDPLNDVISLIVEWCNKNKISIFYGNLEEDEPEIVWNKKAENQWQNYLEVQLNANSKILILSISKNDIADFEDDINELEARLEGDDLLEFKNALEIVKKAKGQIAYYEMGFYYNSKCYKYAQSSSWVDEYQTVMDFITDSEDVVFQDNIKEEESNENVEKYLAKIFENKSYLKASNQMQRQDIVYSILLEEGIEEQVTIFKIARKVESKFILEIKPKLEEERKNMILGFKKEGYNKKQTISKSGYGETIVNKYWYIDD